MATTRAPILVLTVLGLAQAGCNGRDEPIVCDAAGICTGGCPVTNLGLACDMSTSLEDCGEGGVCLSFGPGPVCWQVCIPDQCPDLCTGTDEVCVGVNDPSGNPVEFEPGAPLGVCSVPPTGDQGPYEQCGTAASGDCQADLDCLSITSATGAGAYCAPRCSATATCPGLEGVAGQCVLTPPSGTEPTNCALLCTVASAGPCPAGMTCYDVGGAGACLWPE